LILGQQDDYAYDNLWSASISVKTWC